MSATWEGGLVTGSIAIGYMGVLVQFSSAQVRQDLWNVWHMSRVPCIQCIEYRTGTSWKPLFIWQIIVCWITKWINPKGTHSCLFLLFSHSWHLRTDGTPGQLEKAFKREGIAFKWANHCHHSILMMQIDCKMLLKSEICLFADLCHLWTEWGQVTKMLLVLEV